MFQERNHRYFKSEKEAFDGFGKTPGVIRRLGCYSQRSRVAPSARGAQHRENPDQCKKTMNLLLEYGSYDLRHIFGLHTPPVFPTATIAFWKALSQIAAALSGIHNFIHGGRDFNGYVASSQCRSID